MRIASLMAAHAWKAYSCPVLEWNCMVIQDCYSYDNYRNIRYFWRISMLCMTPSLAILRWFGTLSINPIIEKSLKSMVLLENKVCTIFFLKNKVNFSIWRLVYDILMVKMCQHWATGHRRRRCSRVRQSIYLSISMYLSIYLSLYLTLYLYMCDTSFIRSKFWPNEV